MAGMKDDAGRDCQARCLAVDHLAELQSMIDGGMQALGMVVLKPGDVMAVERKMRTVGVMARSIKLVDGLRRKPGRPCGDDNEDQDMSDDQFGGADDMDPADIVAVRAELDSRLNRIRSFVEAKRVAGSAEPGGTDGPAEADAEAA